MLFTKRLMLKDFVKRSVVKGVYAVATVSILLLTTQTAALAFRATGIASYYGPGFAGRRTAKGDIFNPNLLTAAHNTLPFGSLVRVTNQRNGRSVIVTINDRGAFNADHPRVRKAVSNRREIDLSQGAFASIAPLRQGLVPVKLEVLRRGTGSRITQPRRNKVRVNVRRRGGVTRRARR
jgi:rare lipoprotein A